MREATPLPHPPQDCALKNSWGEPCKGGICNLLPPMEDLFCPGGGVCGPVVTVTAVESEGPWFESRLRPLMFVLRQGNSLHIATSKIAGGKV